MVAGLLAFALTEQLRRCADGALGLLVAAPDAGAAIYHVGQSARGVSVRATVSSTSSQIDALGADPRRADCGRYRSGAGYSVSLTICAVVLATALPLLIRTIRIDRQTEVTANEVAADEVAGAE